MLSSDCEDEIKEIEKNKYSIDIAIGIGILKSMLHKDIINREQYIKMKNSFIKKMQIPQGDNA
ncbi:hypothetical protein [Pseudobacteroides cellulosolvens]|uniref:hypothetical protein n=1 Tax=Pseudobacteroides cellulosolvens TaxID=35825 RepID=UPI0005664341|nr:hypothetical protein [Pseudobacteroides cellulosolvens]